MRTKAGLSLVELMVAVAVIGILVALALPRYHAFLAQARRGEAKSNLAHLASLQAVYKIEHGNYYSGSALLAPDGGIGYKNEDGTRGDCGDYTDDRDQGLNNHLGFRPQACGQLRYFYQLRSRNEAVAFAYADAEGRYIYPDCHGRGSEECDYTRGDAVRMALRDAKPTVCRNITKYCPAGMGTPPPLPPTPTPCVCGPWGPNGGWTPARDTRSECHHFKQTRPLTRTCGGDCPPGLSISATDERNVNGNSDVSNFSPTDPDHHSPCNCAGTPDPRPECTTEPECDCSLADGNWTPVVTPADMYTCECREQTRTRTRICIPKPPCTDSALLPATRELWGIKVPSLASNVCGLWGGWGAANATHPTWTAGQWGDCTKVSDSVCKQQQTRSRSCPNPCVNTNPKACVHLPITYEPLGGGAVQLTVAREHRNDMIEGTFDDPNIRLYEYECTCTPPATTGLFMMYKGCIADAYNYARLSNGERNGIMAGVIASGETRCDTGILNDGSLTGNEVGCHCLEDIETAVRTEAEDGGAAEDFLGDIYGEIEDRFDSGHCNTDTDNGGLECWQPGAISCCDVTSFNTGRP